MIPLLQQFYSSFLVEERTSSSSHSKVIFGLRQLYELFLLRDLVLTRAGCLGFRSLSSPTLVVVGIPPNYDNNFCSSTKFGMHSLTKWCRRTNRKKSDSLLGCAV